MRSAAKGVAASATDVRVLLDDEDELEPAAPPPAASAAASVDEEELPEYPVGLLGFDG